MTNLEKIGTGKKPEAQEKQKVEVERMAREVERCVLEADTYQDGGIASFTSFGSLLEEMLESCMSSRREDEFSKLLKRFNSGVEDESISIFKAGLLLRELAAAINRVDRFYLGPDELNGLNNHGPLSPWEEEAQELARKVLVRAYRGFQEGKMKYYSAEWPMLQAKPFISNSPPEQLFLAEMMRPVLAAAMRAHSFYMDEYYRLFKRLER
ncbi:MAG: hypothetical protein KGI04_02015 [Candidatus Micrarchaeota archaeon]|nr:hypothetical protein [Candidatus Micrarchaeota archaeon]